MGSARHWLRGLWVLLGLVSLLASGCGGGGGGGGSTSTAAAAPPPPPPPPPMGAFNVSGVVQAAGATAVDGDVNDPNAPYTPNNPLASAQLIPNPVSVGGYVNRAGEGPAGRSYSTGDPADFYLADLQADQTVTLTIADGTADLALFLYDGPSDPNPVQASGSGSLRSLTVAIAGTYFIEVRVLDGASTYLLSVGQNATPVATAGVPAGNLSGAFVPGEVILRLKDRPGAFVAQGPVPGDDFMGLAVKAGGPARALLALLPDEQAVQRAYEMLGIPPENVLQAQALAIMSSAQRRRWQTLRIIDALRRRPEVLYAEPNYIVQPLLAPNDQFYPRQWHFPLINLPQAWDTTTGDTGVIVAVVDSGIVSTHPDLQGQLIPGYDFVSDSGTAHDGDGIDADPDDSDGHLAVNPFHGTHVAGIVSAATNNSDGVAGAAWAARIMPLRALGPEGGTMYDVMQGVRFAAGLPNDSGTFPAQRADIINLSVTTSAYSQAAQAVFTAVRNQGVIVVAAAGNTATPATVYPAAYNDVVSVSAVNFTNQLAPYSTFGPTVDVAAPGGVLSEDLNSDGHQDGVYSTWAYDDNGTVLPDYGFFEGTSMAAPHVAGVIALMRSLDSSLTPDTFDTLLASGRITQDLGTPGRDDSFGHGLIDAFKAVTEVAGSLPAPPSLAVNPDSLDFGNSGTQTTLLVVNAGGGNLTVTGFGDDVSGSPDWLAVSAVAVDSDQLGTYRVTVTRAGLADGTYSGKVWFDWSGGRVEVPVVAQVDSIQPAPPSLAVSPGSLNFGNAETQATLEAVNVGGGSLTVLDFGDDVSGSPDWLAVSPESVDSDQLGTYRVTVTRAGLADGTYSGKVWFDWSGGLVEVPVAAQVDSIQPVPPSLAVSPGSLDFGNAENQATLQVMNAGGGSLTLSGFGDDVSGSPDWLAVSAEAVDSDQLGTYRVTVTRAGLVDGSYSGKVWFDWAGGRIEVPIIAQVDAVPEDNDAGFHYVRLLDAATGVPLTEVAVAASLGTYTYQFSDVPAGSYFVVAGSDFDNDGFICESGEACGAYLTPAQPEQITLSNDRADLTFVTAFGTPLGTASTFGKISR